MFPRPADARLIPMDFDDGHAVARFELGAGQTRHDGAMYGGTGIAAAVIAMEAATERPALWATIQFVTSPRSGSVIEMTTDELARGKRISQVQVTGRVEGEVAFVCIGSTATPRDDGLEGQYFTMPTVSDPQDAPPRQHFGPHAFSDVHEHSYISRVEMREVADVDHTSGHVFMWARLLNETVLTPAGVSFLADMVPVAVTRAAGKMGAGFSLDNAMRFGPPVETEWVLLEMSGELAAGGYGHGTLRAWAQDGTLIATGGQTANMLFVVDSMEEFRSRLPRRG